MRNVNRMTLKWLFFEKNYKKSPSGSVIRLSYTSELSMSPNLTQFFETILTFGSSPFPLSKPWLRVHHAPASDIPFSCIFVS